MRFLVVFLALAILNSLVLPKAEALGHPLKMDEWALAESYRANPENRQVKDERSNAHPAGTHVSPKHPSNKHRSLRKRNP